MAPPDAERPGRHTRATTESIELDGIDEAKGTSVPEIIAAIRSSLPTPVPSQWNERERVRAELYAWLNHRHRICDLAEVRCR